MKRIQLFEFEDQTWFPNWLRSCITRLIVVMLRMMGGTSVLSGMLARALRETETTRIVDMGSGAGGVMPAVLRQLRGQPETANITLVMSDLYPNPEAILKFNDASDPAMTYSVKSVDATHLANAPAGLKTMMNCFHHMPPPKARQILESAQGNRQPLFIYELTDNKLPLVAWWLFLPVSLAITAFLSLVLTPFARPLTWRQLIFTYLIPVIPLVYAWDGQASMPRIYGLGDLESLVSKLPTSKNYQWEWGLAEGGGKKVGIYLFGRPVS